VVSAASVALGSYLGSGSFAKVEDAYKPRLFRLFGPSREETRRRLAFRQLKIESAAFGQSFVQIRTERACLQRYLCWKPIVHL
jgi:hypothetical protein